MIVHIFGRPITAAKSFVKLAAKVDVGSLIVRRGCVGITKISK
jgi:hypothetical protein